jgi:hypothetical protein
VEDRYLDKLKVETMIILWRVRRNIGENHEKLLQPLSEGQRGGWIVLRIKYI